MGRLKELRHLAGQINQEYELMAYEFRHYQAKSGLHCLAGCGKCCTNPQIEASPLEMLPLALDLFSRSLGQETLEKLANASASCAFYCATDDKGNQGFCGVYGQRPSLCRMFGAAGYAAKNGGIALSVCREIKNERAHLLSTAEMASERPPLMASWSARIRALDPRLGSQYFPINQALQIMLEKILLIAAYDDDGGDGPEPRPLMPQAG